jgi:thioredoxin-dependent adenylylsulfate APS reductase
MKVEAMISDARTNLSARDVEHLGASDILKLTFDTFRNRAAIVSSFQADGMVILDLASKLEYDVRVMTVDTGRLPQETYDLIDRVRDRYDIDIEVYYPDQDELTQMVTQHGVNAFYNSVSLRLMCCELRKVNPLNRALSGVGAWITGLRRSQSAIRSDVSKVEIDHQHGGILKINPLADWTEEQVWSYIRKNDVPYNKLYDMGYTSIGCAPCTRPVAPGEDERAGRWWWERGVPKECGIHLRTSKNPR